MPKTYKYILVAVIAVFCYVGFDYLKRNEQTISQDAVKRENILTEDYKQTIQQNYGNLPLYFVENIGQLDEKVKYYVKAGGHDIYFTNDEIVYSFIKVENQDDSSKEFKSGIKNIEQEPQEQKVEQMVIAQKIIGANADVFITGMHEQESKVNYFSGNDPSQWQKNITTYKTVKYENVYKGINLEFKGDNNSLKYDFIIAPRTDYRLIKIKYEGVDNIELLNGELLIKTKFGNLTDTRPYVYQKIDGIEIIIKGEYVLFADNTYGFNIENYDNDYELIIDPLLVGF